MKVREILLELAEILDRFANYGSWIDSNTGKIYPVEEFKHADFIEQNFPESKKTSSYKYAFANGLVRIVHKYKYELGVEGTPEDIRKIARMIIATIVQPDMEEVNITHINSLGDRQSKGFGLPEDRRAAIQYINGA